MPVRKIGSSSIATLSIWKFRPAFVVLSDRSRERNQAAIPQIEIA